MNEGLEAIIEAYTEGRLGAEERKAFEARLRHEPEVKDAYELHLEASAAIRAIAREDLKAKIQRIDQAPASKQSLWWGVAATLLVFLGAAWWWNSSNAPSNNLASTTGTQLYSQHFQPYPDRLSTLGDNDSLINVAMGFYQQQQFDSAANCFGLLKEHSDKPDAIALYLSISQLGAGNPKAALAELKRLSSSESLSAEAAHWYYILALLADEQLDEARLSLQEYRSKWSYQRKRADQLHEALK